MNPARITEPSVLININRTFREGMSPDELYKATRKHWKIVPERQPVPPQYAFAVYGGIIREVYQITTWHDSQGYIGRRYFSGQPVPDLSHYVGQSVKHIKPRLSNPIKYLNTSTK